MVTAACDFKVYKGFVTIGIVGLALAKTVVIGMAFSLVYPLSASNNEATTIPLLFRQMARRRATAEHRRQEGGEKAHNLY